MMIMRNDRQGPAGLIGSKRLRRYSAPVILLIAGSLFAGSSANAERVEQVGPFTSENCELPGLISPDEWPFPTVVHFSGTFPDEVEPGEVFQLTDVRVEMDHGLPLNAGGVTGSTVDLGAWGKFRTDPPEPDHEGYGIREGIQIAEVDAVELTAPEDPGLTEVRVHQIQFPTDTGLLQMQCQFNPDEAVLASIEVLAPEEPPEPTVPDDSTTTTVADGAGNGAGEGEGDGSTPPSGGAKPIAGTPSYTG